MSPQITRVTMLKLPSDEHISIALKGFEEFTRNQTRDGKPYIISKQAGPAEGTVKDQGYNLVAKAVFIDSSDMAYYENECEGHRIFKAYLSKHAPVLGLMAVVLRPIVSYES